MAKTTVPQYLSATTSIIDSGDATAITIDGSENVAIGGGTNHDGAALLVSHGDSGVTTFSDNADELVIENSTNAGISILTPNNASGSIIFGDSDDDDIGKIVYNHNDNSLTFTATTVATSGNATVGGTLGVTGAVTANAGVVVDNITIDGTEIDSTAGLDLDVATNMTIDVGGGIVRYYDDGTEFAQWKNNSSDLQIISIVQDKDIVFRGNDGGSYLNALTLDMSDAGKATFNSGVVTGGPLTLGDYIEKTSGNLTLDVAGDIILDADGGDIEFKDGGSTIGYISNSSNNFQFLSNVSDADIVFKGVDGGSTITALTLDMSSAGKAIFNNDIALGDTQKAVFGASEDLQIYHDGSNSYITDQGTGDIYIRGSANVRITDPDNNKMFLGQDGGEVQLYYDGSQKFATKSHGVEISNAGNGNNPTLHVKDTADTECAWFEGNRAGDTGAFISVWHNPSTPQETNRSGIRFQADDDAGNKTTYAMMTMYIDDHTNGSEDGQVQIAVVADGTLEEKVRIDADLMRFRGDAGSSFIRADNRADGHDTGFEIYQNNSRKWEIHNDDSNSDALDFRPAGVQKFTMTQDGKFGIGTTSPDFELDVAGDIGLNEYIYHNGDHNTYIRFTSDTQTFRTGGDDRLIINSSGRLLVSSSSELSPNARVFINANSNSTNPALNLKAATTTSAGSVLIFFAGDSDEVGSVSMSNLEQGSGVSYNTGSDARWKDVTGEARGLEVINKLNPVAFNWKKSGLADEGLIAQEVQPHIPNIVKEGNNGYLQMDYGKLVTPLIKAVQEQQEQIEELKAKIAELESS